MKKKGSVFFKILIVLLLLCFVAFAGMAIVKSSKPMPSREFFENLDKDSSLDEIVDQIGGYGLEGSGIIYHVWVLDDGSKAELVFNSSGQIEFIYIVAEDHSERIYDRENN